MRKLFFISIALLLASCSNSNSNKPVKVNKEADLDVNLIIRDFEDYIKEGKIKLACSFYLNSADLAISTKDLANARSRGNLGSVKQSTRDKVMEMKEYCVNSQ